MIERVYNATALNIAMQDGTDAGQSVPHVHTHIIPRQANDEGEGDKIYEMQEGEEGDIGAWMEWRARGRPKFPKIEEAGRKPRTEKEMEDEAEVLAREMQKEESYKL
jgi:bis(5'-adenosyl)-triphosphatase